jgi:polygalacturonase
VTIINSPMWEINPVLCANVTVRGVNIRSHGPNNDGCDPESCRDVLIERCVFDTGDDCIALKSGRNQDGRRLHAPIEDTISEPR